MGRTSGPKVSDTTPPDAPDDDAGVPRCPPEELFQAFEKARRVKLEHPDCIVSGPLHDLLRWAYDEYVEFGLQESVVREGREPRSFVRPVTTDRSGGEFLLLSDLFDLFRQRLDRRTVRKLFAKFGQTTKRQEARERANELREIHLKLGSPDVAQFAREMAEQNARRPYDKRFGSRTKIPGAADKYIRRVFKQLPPLHYGDSPYGKRRRRRK
jgi:hypothetical protein